MAIMVAGISGGEVVIDVSVVRRSRGRDKRGREILRIAMECCPVKRFYFV
jgi:hypothetical protein